MTTLRLALDNSQNFVIEFSTKIPVPALLVDHVLRLLCNSAHSSVQAYISLRGYTAAITIPPTGWHSLLQTV